SQGRDAAEGPAAEDKALGAFPGFREGNFPNVAQHEPGALIIETGSGLGLTAAASILADAAAGVDRLSGVINGFRPGVSGGQAQALREAVFKTALEGVIYSVGVGGDHADPGVNVVRTARLNIASTRLGLVEVIKTGIDVSSFGSDPAYFEEIVLSKLLGKLKVE